MTNGDFVDFMHTLGMDEAEADDRNSPFGQAMKAALRVSQIRTPTRYYTVPVDDDGDVCDHEDAKDTAVCVLASDWYAVENVARSLELDVKYSEDVRKYLRKWNGYYQWAAVLGWLAFFVCLGRLTNV